MVQLKKLAKNAVYVLLLGVFILLVKYLFVPYFPSCLEFDPKCPDGSKFYLLDFGFLGVGLEKSTYTNNWQSLALTSAPRRYNSDFRIFCSLDIRSTETKSQQKRWAEYIRLRNNILKDYDLFESWLVEADYTILNEKASGNNLLHFSSQNRDPRVLKKLLQITDLDVNAQNSIGFTPLHTAVYSGNINNAELLIHNGANLKLKDKNGLSVLDWCEEPTEHQEQVCGKIVEQSENRTK